MPTTLELVNVEASIAREVTAMATVNFETMDVTQLTEEDVAELAVRLEQDDYESVFDCLNDWHLMRAIAFQKPELAEPYMYLLDLEAFDES
ncbi:DUF2555 domain-containing protein [Alkalinema pantanalense CENA528]|uniref:protein IsiD n=1 Tax=Alkalinema pantanalense TaxID=1620705 RepID=UPI003D6FE045